MGFLSNAWEAAKQVGKGLGQVFIGIGEALVLIVYAIGYVLFTIVEHLYNWIDGVIEKFGNKVSTTTMLSPEDTEEFITTLRNKGKTTLPEYTPGVNRSIMSAHDSNGKVIYSQVTSTEKGFEPRIAEAFKKGHIIEQPICI